MPLQRQNLRLVPVPSTSDLSLEELLGPPELRPGELHELFPFSVPPAFRSAAAAAGAPTVLAVTTVVERELALDALGETEAGAVAEALDRRAEVATVAGKIGPCASEYVRRLLSLLHGRHGELPEATVAFVPVRVADRLRATGYRPRLRPPALRPALCWELAAVLTGQTMAEWALLEVLRVRGGYSEAAERQSAASTTAS